MRLRLIADVPLGAFLSGGINSSAVVAMMARAGGGPVKTFSIGFADRALRRDPLCPHGRASATPPSIEELIVEPDAVAVLPRLVWHYGEPFADPSAVPTYYVSRDGAAQGDGRAQRRWRRRGVPRLPSLPRDALPGQLDRLPHWGRQRCRPGCSASRRADCSAACSCAQIRDVLTAPAPLRARRYRADDRVLCRSRQGRAAMARRCAAVSATRRSTGWRPISPRAIEPRRRRQLGRLPHLSARRSDGEGRCRQHGARAGGALAAARP